MSVQNQTNTIIRSWEDVHRVCLCDVHPLEKISHLVENRILFSSQFIATLYAGFPLLSVNVFMGTVKSMADRQFRAFFDTIREQGMSLDQLKAILQVKEAVALSALGFGEPETVTFHAFLEVIEREESDRTQEAFLLYTLEKMDAQHQAIALHFFLQKGIENASLSSLLIAEKIAAFGVEPKKCSFELLRDLNDTEKGVILENCPVLSKCFEGMLEGPSLHALITRSQDETWKEMRWLSDERYK